MIGIYKITSPSGKVYIGQSWNVEKRWKSYKYLSNNKLQVHIYNSICKYGVDNHKFSIVKELDKNTSQEVMDLWEQFYIYYYKNKGIELLNIRLGGKYTKLSQETKDKMSKSSKKISKRPWNKSCWSKNQYRRNLKKCKQVIQYSLDGKFIKEWSSMKQAEDELNIKKGYICSYLRGNMKNFGEFEWKYK